MEKLWKRSLGAVNKRCPVDLVDQEGSYPQVFHCSIHRKNPLMMRVERGFPQDLQPLLL